MATGADANRRKTRSFLLQQSLCGRGLDTRRTLATLPSAPPKLKQWSYALYSKEYRRSPTSEWSLRWKSGELRIAHSGSTVLLIHPVTLHTGTINIQTKVLRTRGQTSTTWPKGPFLIPDFLTYHHLACMANEIQRTHTLHMLNPARKAQRKHPSAYSNSKFRSAPTPYQMYIALEPHLPRVAKAAAMFSLRALVTEKDEK